MIIKLSILRQMSGRSVTTEVGCDLVHVIQVYAVVGICNQNEARLKKFDVQASICSGVIYFCNNTFFSGKR